MSKLPAMLFAILCGAALGSGVYSVFWRIIDMETLHYVIRFTYLDPWTIAWHMLAGALLMAVIAMSYAKALRKVSASSGQPQENRLAQALWPLLAAFPLGFLDSSFSGSIAFIAIVSFTVLRLLAAWPDERPLTERLSLSRLGVWLMLVAIVGYFIANGLKIQFAAFNALRLGCDWEMFASATLNTLKGNWFFDSFHNASFMGVHLEPGMVLLLAPWLCLFPSPDTMFAINSVALYVGAFALFALAKTKGCSDCESLALAAIFCLHPALSAMNVSIFYGFHESSLQVPLVIAFFLALEKGWRKSAVAILLLSLSIKETDGIFWSCVGFFLAFDKKNRILGLTMFVLCAAYFLVAVKLVIPYFRGHEDYEFLALYSYLGSNITQIALSPILRPGVFFAQLFRPDNFIFVALILVPAFATSCYKPKYYIGFIGLLVFLMLKNDIQLCTLNSWYQAEIIALLNVASVAGFAALCGRDGSKMKFPLAWGLGEAAKPSVKLGLAALAASFAAALLAYAVFSLAFPFSKNEWASTYATMPDRMPELEQVKKLVPEGAAISTTTLLQGHFLFSHEAHPLSVMPPSDYIALDLPDLSTPKIEDFRRRLILSGNYDLVANVFAKNQRLMLYAKKSLGIPALPKEPLTSLSDEKWKALGEELPVSEAKDVSARLVQNTGKPPLPNGDIEAILFVRIDKPRESDITLTVKVRSGSLNYILKSPFGNGATPAYLAKAGETFALTILLGNGGPQKITVEARPLDSPDSSLPPF